MRKDTQPAPLVHAHREAFEVAAGRVRKRGPRHLADLLCHLMEKHEVVADKEDLGERHVPQEVDGGAVELPVSHVAVEVAPIIFWQVGRPHDAIALVDVNPHIKGLATLEEVTRHIEGKRVGLKRARVTHAVDGAAVVRDHIAAVEKVGRHGREALEYR